MQDENCTRRKWFKDYLLEVYPYRKAIDKNEDNLKEVYRY